MRDDRERLLDVLEAIEKISKYASRGREAFDSDELIQNWILHHIQIVGEAVRGVSTDLRNAHPEVEWTEIIGMRNILVHDYFGINTDLVWDTVVNDLLPLKAKVQAIVGILGAKKGNKTT